MILFWGGIPRKGRNDVLLQDGGSEVRECRIWYELGDLCSILDVEYACLVELVDLVGRVVHFCG